MKSGEEHAWQILGDLDPLDVCARTGCTYDEGAGTYELPVYGFPVSICPAQRTITGTGDQLDVLLGRLAYFSKLSTVHYMIGAKDAPPSGRLVKPAEMRGGAIYYEGSHVLPLAGVAGKFGNDREAFLEKGAGYNGVAAEYGDASVTLTPFPNLQLVLVLWVADDEFPARADLLFDSNCELHAQPDIIWSIAMMTVLMML